MSNAEQSQSEHQPLLVTYALHDTKTNELALCDLSEKLMVNIPEANIFLPGAMGCHLFSHVESLNELVDGKSPIELINAYGQEFSGPYALVVSEINLVEGKIIIASDGFTKRTVYSGGEFRGWGNFAQLALNDPFERNIGPYCVIDVKEATTLNDAEMGAVLVVDVKFNGIDSASGEPVFYCRPHKLK